MPGTAFFELALAAAVSLCADNETAAVALAAGTISAPCMLASTTPADADFLGAEKEGRVAFQVLECAAWFGARGPDAAGAVEVRSTTGGTDAPTAGGTSQLVAKGHTHLSCMVMSLTASVELSGKVSDAKSGKSRHALAAAIAAGHNQRDKPCGSPSTIATVAQPLSCAGAAILSNHTSAFFPDLHMLEVSVRQMWFPRTPFRQTSGSGNSLRSVWCCASASVESGRPLQESDVIASDTRVKRSVTCH